MDAFTITAEQFDRAQDRLARGLDLADEGVLLFISRHIAKLVVPTIHQEDAEMLWLTCVCCGDGFSAGDDMDGPFATCQPCLDKVAACRSHGDFFGCTLPRGHSGRCRA